MLELLRIKNLALIEDLEMEFSQGLNVLTGETGAGKSFILKALSFVTGEKLEANLVRPGKDKAIVEALFVVDDEDLIIRRELTADTGRSRLYINDQLSSLEVARDMRHSLLVHTSQHGQQQLLQAAYQAAMLDAFMQEPELVTQKNNLLKQVNEILAKRKELEQTVIELEQKREMLEFQQLEIDRVAPLPNEEEQLEKLRESHKNHADIENYSDKGLEALLGTVDGTGLYACLGELEKAVGRLMDLDPDLDQELQHTTEWFLDIQGKLRDMESNLRGLSARTSQDADIEHIESRLYALSQLKRRLKRPLASIIALKEEITETLDFLDNSELERKQLIKEEEAACDLLAKTLKRLNDCRQHSAEDFSRALEQELAKLGFSEYVKVAFDFSPVQLHKEREDCVELRGRLLWMPNPGQAPQPLDKIASGGELSRFLLAFVTLMSKNNPESPVMIFDEVDTGVGGLTLNSVAQSLEELSASHQLLLITHWPQLAAKAKNHFFIQKNISEEQTFTHCVALTGEDIAKELSRMAGGCEQGKAFADKLV